MPYRNLFLSLLASLAILGLAVSAASCGNEDSRDKGGEDEPVKVGALSVTLLSSRYLDRKVKEDVAYLADQPPPGKGLDWFGVFLEIQNEGDRSKRVPTITIVDATGRTYSAFPSESPQALHFGDVVKPSERLPKSDTPAQQGPDEGALVIFRLGKAAIKNQPLILHIEGFHRKEADLRLDL